MKKKIKIFNLTYLVLMSNIQDRNNITNCYMYYITNIALQLADQQLIWVRIYFFICFFIYV